MNTKFKRLLAMILTISMVVSLVGAIPVFADGEDTTVSQWQIDGEENPNYYIVDEHTDSTLNNSANPVRENTEVDYNNGEMKSVEDGAVQVAKTIVPTGNENEFDITLKVTTTEKIDKLTLSDDAAVVLVIDNSSSMYQDWNGNNAPSMDQNGDTGFAVAPTKNVNGEEKVNVNQDYLDYIGVDSPYKIPYIQNGRIAVKDNDEEDWRITQAKNAAIAFATNFMEASGDRYISVVSFSEIAKLETEEYSIGAGTNGWTDTLEEATTAIEAMRPINYTNIDSGLLMAKEQLDKLPATVKNRYVILLADGDTNRRGANGVGTFQDTAESKEAAIDSSEAIAVTAKIPLYNVAFAMETEYDKNGKPISPLNYLHGTNSSAAELDQLNAELANIEQLIETQAMAWTVTDPMGTCIDLENGAIADLNARYTKEGAEGAAVTETADGFQWNLRNTKGEKPVTVDDTTYFTYSMTYTVTLDTEDKDFEPKTSYLTNGETTLNYRITTTTTEGETTTTTIKDDEVNFDVPAVEGEYPTYKYNVYHYLWDGKNYDSRVLIEDPGNNPQLNKEVKKLDVVHDDYIDYSSRYYEKSSFSTNGGIYGEVPGTGDNKGITINKQGQNLNFYYVQQKTGVTVTHTYYAVNVVDGEQKRTKVDEPNVISDTGNIGADYFALTDPKDYKLVSSKYGPTKEDVTVTKQDSQEGYHITLDKEATNNVVFYEYEKLATGQAYTDVTVNHHYHLYKASIGDDGKLTHTELTAVEEKPFYGDKYLLNEKFIATPIYHDYTLLTTENTAESISGECSDNRTIEALGEKGTNVIDLHYEMVTDSNLYPDTDMTVTHKYYTTTQYVNKNGELAWGAPVEDVGVGADVSYDTTTNGQDVYTGEIYTIDPILKGYDGCLDDSDDFQAATNDSKTITLAAKKEDGTHDNHVTMEYIKHVPLHPTDVTVYHHYVYEYEVMDEETGEITKERITTIDEDGTRYKTHPITGEPLYPDQSYTAETVTEPGDGHAYAYSDQGIAYTGHLNTTDKTVTLQAAGNEIHLNYYLFEDLTAQSKEDALIVVHHNYYDRASTYVNGTMKEVLSVSKVDAKEETITGVAGTTYTANPIDLVADVEDFYNADLGSYEDRAEWQVSYTCQTTDRSKQFEKNAVKHIYLNYLREIEMKDPTKVTVEHYYYNYVGKVVNGEYKIVLDPTPVDSKLYPDMEVNVKGETLYAGMSYWAPLELKHGFAPSRHNDQSITSLKPLPEENKIVLNYYGFVDQTVPATVAVTYHYKTITKSIVDGKLKEETTEDRTESLPTLKTVADISFTAPGVPYGYEYLDSASNNDDFTRKTGTKKLPFFGKVPYELYTIDSLEPGHNTIDIYYLKTNDLTQDASYTVIHEYYYKSLKTGEVFPDDSPSITYTKPGYIGQDRTIPTVYTKGLYSIYGTEASNDTLTETMVEGEVAYDFTLTQKENKVTIKYIRTEDDLTDTSVVVNHWYSTYDKHTGKTTKDGKTEKGPYGAHVEDGTYTAPEFLYDYTKIVDGEEVTHTYEFKSGEPTITLVQDSTKNVIDLFYVREIDTTPDTPRNPKPTYYTLIVNWVDEEGNPLADQEKTTKLRYSSTYETEQKAFDGYSFLKMDEDSDPVSGVMHGNREVTYVYTPLIDIPEIDIPVTEIPDTPDEPTPPTETPDTESDLPITDVPEVDIPLKDIPETDIPLSDAPNTGDNRTATFFLLTSLLSAAGLVWLLKVDIQDKKKKHSK